MKKVIYSLPFKVVAFILCVISLIITILSALSLVTYCTRYNPNQSFLEQYKTNNYNYFINDAGNLVHDIAANISTDYSSSYTNIRYIVLNHKNEIIFNSTGNDSFDKDEMWYKAYYQVWPNDIENHYSSYQVVHINGYEDKENVYTVYGYIDTTFPIYSRLSYNYYILKFEHSVLSNITLVGIVFIASAILLIFTFVFLMVASGKRKDSTEIVQGITRKLPFDLIIALSVALVVLMIVFLVDGTIDDLLRLVLKILTMITGCSLFVGCCMVLSTRLKTGTFLKNNITCFAVKFVIKIIKKIYKLALCMPFILRSLLVVAITVAVDLFILVLATSPSYHDSNSSVSLWFIRTTVYVLGALYISIMLYKLKKAGEALANGDLQHRTDTTLLVLDFKKHGENLNSLSDGLSEAVENRIRSERLKTDLITNVSHDLKTPLTSIINYSELIVNEECDSEKHKEYAEVLLRKSGHLKRLLDDLLEVSKASSGNMEVNLSKLDAEILLNQLSGEYEEKLSQNELKLVMREPEQPIYIMADERRIWRVFENLMNNACKYSLKGSRVYVDLCEKGDDVIFSFKNTSASQLNIDATELMERFVRGDGSRTSEGSGLGLSIVSSFTEIQGGKTRITIDGDLFRVDVIFKKA